MLNYLPLSSINLNKFNLYENSYMRKPGLIFLCSFIQQFSFSQLPLGVSGKTHFYFVRHAEKESGTDPVLTEKGRQRAGDLVRALKDQPIQRIYVTQFKRTQLTADSMRLQLGIDTVHYQASDNGLDLFDKIAAHGDLKKTILVIGHSNTVPYYIKKAGVVNYPVTGIPDAEFDNLYKVYYKRNFIFQPLKARVKHSKYGAASGVSAAMQ